MSILLWLRIAADPEMFKHNVNKGLKCFADAAQSLKLYRRAELLDNKDRPLIEQLYVDPLPDNGVLSVMMRPNTTFVIGRKGTGKSTVFQRAQHEIRKQKRAASAYIDIKTVFESATVDPGLISRVALEQRALSEETIRRLLLYKIFIRTIILEVQSELKKQVQNSFLNLVREKLGSGRDQVFEALDDLIENYGKADFIDVTGLEDWDRKETIGSKTSSSAKAGVSMKVNAAANPSGLSGLAGEVRGDFEGEGTQADNQEAESSYARLLMRTFNITAVIEQLAAILKLIEVRQLFLFY
jgi:hypothetical protein